ncbi:BTAD domain-containing putative transcriptional regulator [Amycolatopsis sp. NPDC004625]|uniref:AfsR/SARP family transcriptional regulator n=1 Tax=Amycolatopsis sp. NPDC004625 TaxID=3154670 RepID=UPI0033A9104F
MGLLKVVSRATSMNSIMGSGLPRPDFRSDTASVEPGPDNDVPTPASTAQQPAVKRDKTRSALVRALRGTDGKCQNELREQVLHSNPRRGESWRMEIAFGILGQTTMRMHGQLTTGWGSPKLQKVLAALLTQPRVRMGVTPLAEWVWSADEREPLDPVATFRTYAGRIGKALREAGVPATLRTVDGALLIDVERTAIDYFAAGEMIETARRYSKAQDHEAACEMVTAALGLWQGQPLADLTSQRARDWRYAAVHTTWLPANRLLLGELIALGRFEAALGKLDELQREHRTDIGLVRRRLQVLRELGLTDDMGAYHLTARRLLQAEGDPAAAEDLLRYYNSLTASPEPGRRTGPGARSAAERLEALPPPRPPADRPVPGPPGTLLPAFRPRGRSLLPPAPPDFVGHQDLLEHLDRLACTAEGRFRPGVVVLDGLAGIGKTALAVHWAHRQYGGLVDTALYLDLHGFDGSRPLEAADVVDALLDSVDVPIARLATRARREGKLREILAETRTLVVLDNAANSAHVLPLLFTLSPSLVLVTSRQALTALASRHGARHCSVTPLDDEHAAQLLAGRIGRRGVAEQAALTRITALCGGLPLALQLVAHHIESRRGAALTEFADELQDESRLLDIGDDGDDPPANVRAAFSVTYHALPPEARELFRLIGLSPTRELTLPAAAALAGAPVKEVQHALDVLAGTHFLDHTGFRGRYRIHDLLRAFARELAEQGGDREHAERRLLSYFLHASYNADRLLFPFRPPVPMLPSESGTPVAEHASESAAASFLLNERTNFSQLVPWAAERGYHEYAWRIPHNLYGLYRRYGFYSDLCDTYRVAVSSVQSVVDLESEGATRSDYGKVTFALGDRDSALQQFHLAAALAQRTQSAMGIAISLSNLGNYEAEVGNLEAAADLYRRALDQLAETGNPGAESAILHRLAVTLRSAEGCHDEVLALFRRALSLREGIGNEHGQAETLAELAATLADLQEYADARHHGLRSLAIVERIHDLEVGPRACCVLALIHYREADHAAAIGYARQAIRLARRTHTAPVEADALHILGHALHNTGRLAAAEEGWLTAAAIYGDLGNQERERHLVDDLASLTEPPPAR